MEKENGLQIFKNSEFGSVRTLKDENGEPWFMTSDICKSLDIKNPSQALSRLDEDEKFTTLISNEGAASGVSMASFVSEAGLYTITIGSKKKEAKEFKRWITHDVIPTIRKTGAYMTPNTLEQAIANPDFAIGLLTKLKEEQERNRELDAKIEKDKPKVLFAEAISDSDGVILVRDMAKYIKQNALKLYPHMGEKNFFKWLRYKNYLNEDNTVSQRYNTQGLFRMTESHHIDRYGNDVIRHTSKVTTKGQKYFINKFLIKKNTDFEEFFIIEENELFF